MSSPFDTVMTGGGVADSLDSLDISLLETLDHVLDRGLVIAGEITIAVADIDLIFVGLNILASSVETANEVLRQREVRATLSDPEPPGVKDRKTE